MSLSTQSTSSPMAMMNASTEWRPSHSPVPARLPPRGGEHALAGHLRGPRIELVPDTVHGKVRGR
jgi:hypothetical protein